VRQQGRINGELPKPALGSRNQHCRNRAADGPFATLQPHTGYRLADQETQTIVRARARISSA
jgi:hypothetical protein